MNAIPISVGALCALQLRRPVFPSQRSQARHAPLLLRQRLGFRISSMFILRYDRLIRGVKWVRRRWRVRRRQEVVEAVEGV